MKLFVGFITYEQNSLPYLPLFMESLLASLNEALPSKDYYLMAVDNSAEENNDNQAYLKQNYKDLELLWPGKNLGFGAAYNLMIKKALELKVEYFLMVNPDVLLEKESIKLLLQEISGEASLASVCPKILKWDFDRNIKTKIIDSQGLLLLTGLIFKDLGQGEEDKKQYHNPLVLGPSGAGALFRLEALEKIALSPGEYFDERFFMYKEDCDLAYRLFLAGYKSKNVSSAVFYHDRTVSSKKGFLAKVGERAKRGPKVNLWSLRGQLLLWHKYGQKQPFSVRMIIKKRRLGMFLYALIFEPYLLKEFLKKPA